MCYVVEYLLLKLCSPIVQNVLSTYAFSSDYDACMSPQLCQRVKDIKRVIDLFNILNEGGTIKNMMPNDFDFKQFQVSLFYVMH